MVAKNEKMYRLQRERMIIGIAAAIVIELPLILLLSGLFLNDLISFIVWYFGMISTGIGGLLVSLAIANAYVRKKHYKINSAETASDFE
jgi:hypothetical protein